MSESSKECFKCGAVKPLSDFYAHPKMSDRRLGKCKVCTCADSEENRKRLMLDAAWVEKELERQRVKQRKKSPVIPADKKREYTSRYQARNQEKRSAHVKVGNAIRDGRLKRQPCIVCGSVKSQAHHEDYSKPLDVIWYCTKHHAERHIEIRKIQRMMRNNPPTGMKS